MGVVVAIGRIVAWVSTAWALVTSQVELNERKRLDLIERGILPPSAAVVPKWGITVPFAGAATLGLLFIGYLWYRQSGRRR